MKLMNWEENAITFPFWKKMDALSLKLNRLRFNDSLMIYPMQVKKRKVTLNRTQFTFMSSENFNTGYDKEFAEVLAYQGYRDLVGY